jgi:diacylglycerol kinase family enzyme
MSSQSIVMMTNIESGWNKKYSDKMRDLISQYDLHNINVTDLPSIEDALDAAAQKAPDVLVVNGGDGTVDAVVTFMRLKRMFKNEPSLIFLPGGTTNMTHHAAGYKGCPHRILSQYLSNKDKYKVQNMSPLSVKVKGQKNKVFGFFLGGAAIPLAIISTRKTYHKKGFTSTGSQILSIGGMILKLALGRVEQHPVLKPQDVQYSYDEHNWRDVETVFFYVTSLPKLLLSFPGAADGQMAYCGLTHPYKNVIGNLFRFWRKKILPHQGAGFYRHDVPEAIHLKLRGGWTLDGELFDGPRGKDDRVDLIVKREEPLSLMVAP